MKTIGRITGLLCLLAVALLTGPSTQARVLDNFDDNTKTAWQDFTFVPGFGLPKEQNGQFRFELPAAGQAIFTASQKTSEIFTLQEGRTIEFSVDIIEGGAKDSFAVLAFIPNTGGNNPGTLAGYGLAKSTTDILITKGINKYFVADDSDAAELKNDNVTLVLSMTAKNGNVIITGKVLDKENNNAVLWEKTVVDTPTADVLADGNDDPPAPYLTTGYFTLYCYEDFDAGAPEDPYKIYYDNAEAIITDSAVLDDFNDNTKTAWQDFTFVPGFGLPKEQNGQFRFELPAAGQAIFTASQKTSRAFELKEGERIVFSVDVIEAGAKDSFAVLAFIPNTGGNNPGTLAGYGFAKSTTDVLITKGINKYFVADAGLAAQIKNENITLLLSITIKNGNAIINAKVLDKDDNNAVLWDKTVVDTPSADVLTDGNDDPPAPYLTTGYFTLYCYQDFDAGAPEDPYKVYYDNAVVGAAPAAANTAPIISEVLPAEFASFLPASTTISFKVADDKDIVDSKLSVALNGTTYTTANGLTVSGSGSTKTATLGGLAANVNYAAVITAEDSEGLKSIRTLYFDTFAQNNLTIEIEDYNFDYGAFIDNPVPVAEGGFSLTSFSQQIGYQDVDFNETRATPRPQDTLYRPSDPVRMAHSRDNARPKFTAAGGPEAGVYDYDVGDIAQGEWLNFTRTFPNGTYEVYLRQALANMAFGESILEEVTGDRTKPDQTTKVLGSFLGELTGFQYRNFALTDGAGLNKIVLRLSGVTTLRLRQVTADAPDGARLQNYLIFIPAADTGIQRATIANISPTPGSTVDTVTPVISVTIQNRETSVKTNSIVLTVNSQTVAPNITADANSATVTFPLSPLPPSGQANTARIVFLDNQDVAQTNDWTFTIRYNSLNPANAQSGSGIDSGFKVRVVQAPAGSGLDNSLARAEDQLAANSKYEKTIDTNAVAIVINYNKVEGQQGAFGDDSLVPGIEADVNGTDDFAVEILAYLNLTAGTHRFGVITDDGYKIQSGATLGEVNAPVVAFHNGGPANETFDFLVQQPGLYPFRMVWYERGGAAYAEWFSVNTATGERTLINDPASPNSIKAYRSITAPPLQLESAATVVGPFATETSAALNENTKTFTLTAPTTTRFYRIRGPLVVGSKIVIQKISLQGANIVIQYDRQAVVP